MRLAMRFDVEDEHDMIAYELACGSRGLRVLVRDMYWELRILSKDQAERGSMRRAINGIKARLDLYGSR